MGYRKIASKQNLYLISVALSNFLFYAFLIPAALLYPGYSSFRHTVKTKTFVLLESSFNNCKPGFRLLCNIPLLTKSLQTYRDDF